MDLHALSVSGQCVRMNYYDFQALHHIFGVLLLFQTVRGFVERRLRCCVSCELWCVSLSSHLIIIIMTRLRVHFYCCLMRADDFNSYHM